MSDGKNREGLLLPILIPLVTLVVIGLVLFGFSEILLAVSHTAATLVALIAATGIVVTAAIVAGRKKVTGGSLLSMVGVSAGIAMMMGGLAIVAVGPEKEAEEGGEGQVVTLAAPPGAAADGFSTDALSVKSGEPISLEFDNQDPNVPHNVVVFDGKDATAPELFKGELITGPEKVTYPVPALGQGEYFFNCEVHPATMQGIIDSGEGGGDGGGAGPTLVAQGTEFDTDTLELPADTETVLTFDNQDADTPHNLAIYEDDTAATPLFQGELVTGVVTVEYKIPAIPAGEYYFQCDVHPNMSGTVVVGGPGGGGAGGAPSETGSPSAPPSDTGGSATASIAAAGLEFDTDALSFPANEPVILTFDNTDDVNATGPHNVAIYTDDSLAETLFMGDLVDGPATVDYEVPALQPGEYYFQCDVHPTMSGTVSVA